MGIKLHPTHGYKISPTTGKRLRSVNDLNKRIADAERELEALKTQLQEHLMEVLK